MSEWYIFLSQFSEVMVFFTSDLMASDGRANIATDFEVLTEGDIPGALLDRKSQNSLIFSS